MTRATGPSFDDAPTARLEVVAELASLINTSFDLDEIFRTAIGKLARVLYFRRASVVLISQDRTHYYLHTLYDQRLGGFVAAEGRYPLNRGLTGRAILAGEAMRVDEFEGTDGIRGPDERRVSALIVPLRVGDEVIGTLNLGADEAGAYEAEDLDLAAVLGRQIATSLYYSRLLATIGEQREQLAAEHAGLRAERARLEALIEASDAAILMADADRVTYANGEMADLVGLPREALVGADLEIVNRALVGALRDPGALAPQAAAMAGSPGELRDRIELVFPRRRICQRTVTSVHGRAGETLGHLLIYRDVTREAEAEAAKSEFVSLVSHEMRTPLTSVRTSLGLLLRGAAGGVSESVRELLAIALRNLERLIRLVDDLLDLARIESGRVVTRTAPVAMEDAAARALDALRAFAEERRIEIEHMESDADTVVLADSDRLQQIIVNLLSNAIKFSPEDARVRLSWWKQAEHAVLEIGDEGPGVPAADLESIFEVFRQLERPDTRRYGGAGLGLAISRTIARQMGGDLWAESEEGQGARFFLRLRLAGARPAELPAGPEAGGARHSVLIVESDSDLRRLFSAEFAGSGWQVNLAATGMEGFGRAESGVDLVAVGVELEDMHGLELVRRLRERPSTVDVPALLVGPVGDAVQAGDFGADGWVAGDAEALIAEAGRLASVARRAIILVVEDDPAVRNGLARGLRRAGYACMQAATAVDGLKMARARRPRAMIIDLQLPGRDGLALLRDLRGEGDLADIPVIIVSGRSKPESAREIETLGAEFIAKPFNLADLIREIDRCTGRLSDEA